MTTEQFTTELKYVRNVSPKTLLLYGWSFKAFAGTLESRAAIVQRIAELRERKVQAVTVNTYLRCVNAYFRWLHLEHGQTLLRIPRLKEEQKVIRTLTPQHVDLLLKHKPQGRNQLRAWTGALVILDGGLRISEALGLRRPDLDFDNMLIRVKGKGGKERLVPMSLELRKHLYRFVKERTGLVFETRNGTAVTQRNFQRDFYEVCRRLGIKGVRCSPHTLRHTFAVNYLRKGGSVFHLQKILGHSTLEMTRRYCNLMTEDLQAVHSQLSLLSGRG